MVAQLHLSFQVLQQLLMVHLLRMRQILIRMNYQGGVIVSLGSTGGLGYAPLVPAKVKLLVGTGASVGMVTSVVGVAYSGLQQYFYCIL